jgi:hypothetical protein
MTLANRNAMTREARFTINRMAEQRSETRGGKPRESFSNDFLTLTKRLIMRKSLLLIVIGSLLFSMVYCQGEKDVPRIGIFKKDKSCIPWHLGKLGCLEEISENH